MPAPKPIPPPEGYLLPRIAKHMRETKGVLASDLARRLGVTPSAVTQYEKPDTAMTEPVLRAYAAALDVPDFEKAIVEALIGFQLASAPGAAGAA